jgi:ATP-dependent DNA helicase RecG
MCQTNNGFTIAEEDLKYRGTGDLIGTVQSGSNKYVELIVAYPKFFKKVKDKVAELYKEGKLDSN